MTALTAAVVNLLSLFLGSEGGDGDPTGGAGQLLEGAPTWVRYAYAVVLLIGGVIGLWKAIGTLRGSKGGDRDHVEEFLDKADRELVELRATNDRLDDELVRARAELDRSREREAGLRATVETLRELLAERRRGGEGATPP